jgi:hypothetical protein
MCEKLWTGIEQNQGPVGVASPKNSWVSFADFLFNLEHS